MYILRDIPAFANDLLLNILDTATNKYRAQILSKCCRLISLYQSEISLDTWYERLFNHMQTAIQSLIEKLRAIIDTWVQSTYLLLYSENNDKIKSSHCHMISNVHWQTITAQLTAKQLLPENIAKNQ